MNFVEKQHELKYNEKTNNNYMVNKKLEVIKVKNGYVLPVRKAKTSLSGQGGVVDEMKNYIIESQMDGFNMSKRLYGIYNFNNKNVDFVDEKVIYINYFMHHWGHYLIDVINRLWYILDKDIANYKFVYIVKEKSNDTINGNYLELLNLLGIKKEQLIAINQVTQFREIIIPEASICPGKYFTQEYKNIFSRIIVNSEYTKKKNKQKIVCSRSQFAKAGKKEIGGELLEKVFTDNGYIKVYFEQLSVKQQIETLNNASEIVAISGTLPHNILFLENEAHVTILNKTYRLNLHQFLINQISNANVDFVDTNISPLPVLYGYGPFIMCVTRPLEKYCQYYKLKLNQKVNYKLSFNQKVWYAMTYIMSYRFKIPKDNNYKFSEIRACYNELRKESKND